MATGSSFCKKLEAAREHGSKDAASDHYCPLGCSLGQDLSRAIMIVDSSRIMIVDFSPLLIVDCSPMMAVDWSLKTCGRAAKVRANVRAHKEVRLPRPQAYRFMKSGSTESESRRPPKCPSPLPQASGPCSCSERVQNAPLSTPPKTSRSATAEPLLPGSLSALVL
jgi:hypothetical protein